LVTVFFESPPVKLSKLLDEIHDGSIQLPDFQRPWKWDDQHIVSLLATVTLGYPMGAVMTLETGDPETQFKPRPLAGAPSLAGVRPSKLVMDGQQRLTALYQALRSGKPVETADNRGTDITRWYYVDIAKSLSDLVSREEAIVSVAVDRKILDSRTRIVTVDLTTQEDECRARLFPFRLVLDPTAVNAWQRDFVRVVPDGWDVWDRFQPRVLENIKTYELPEIRLARETPKEAVCTVFEKVNTGGVALSVFELLTAVYAGREEYFRSNDTYFSLPDHWKRSYEEFAAHEVLTRIENTDFLQAVTLVSTHHRRRGRTDTDPFKQPAASCKRGDILDLPLDEYLKWSPQIVSALRWTAGFLGRQGVFGSWDVPYRSQVVSLAAIRAVLGPEADDRGAEEKITKWYWCGVLGEQYGGSPESQLPRDLEQVVAWVRGDRREPASVSEAEFSPARLDTMNTRNSAAYKGVLTLLMREGAIDWTYTRGPIDAAIYTDQQVDVAPIFPKTWCDKNGIPREFRDSIVNKTPLSSRTRRTMGTRVPHVYLRQLEAEAGLPGNWMDDIIQTHRIDPKFLRSSEDGSAARRNFDAFYQARSTAMLDLIYRAMGKDLR
jgi:hypothetical protein